MNDFSVRWKNMWIGSFFCFLIFLMSGAIHFPAYYGDIVRQFNEALHESKE